MKPTMIKMRLHPSGDMLVLKLRIKERKGMPIAFQHVFAFEEGGRLNDLDHVDILIFEEECRQLMAQADSEGWGMSCPCLKMPI